MNPGDLYNKHMAKKKKIKHTGKFGGKSNALGQGGRAAQLKAQGVPGGVIGNLARAAQAAPGQKNFHKKKKRHKKGDLRPASVVVQSEQNASHHFYGKKGKKHKAKKKLQPIGKNQAYGTNKSVKGSYPSPQKLGWGTELGKGTLKMNPGTGKSMFKRKKGMRCKKKHKHTSACM